MVDNARFHSRFPHEMFMLFAPQSRYCKHPADFGLDDGADLLPELGECLVGNKPKGFGNHGH